jgi:uncharacterized repeat protein (TIGR03803 family)
MTHKKCSPGLIHICLLFGAALTVAVPASASWKEKVLYSFQGYPDGSLPAGGVVFDKKGNLFGATQGGGSDDNGEVFELSPPAQKGGAWTETVLYSFLGNLKNDGKWPSGGLVIDGSGNLYGVTAYGGTGDCVLLGAKVGCGAVYEISPPKQKGGAWTETILYSFPTAKQGYLPNGNLVFDSAGNLYGATTFGGTKGTTCNAYYGGQCGVVFELSPPKKGGAWTEKVLHSFAGIARGQQTGDGANPNGGLVLDSKGSVYGTTYIGGYNCPHNSNQGCGTVFELAPPITKGGAWTETVLHHFNRDTSDNGLPSAGLVMDAKDNLYGTTVGTIFRLAPPSAKSSRWRETILYTFGQNAYDPKGGLIFDQSGNLYGTTYVGGGGSLQGSAFRLKPPNKNAGTWTFGVIHGFLGPPDGEFPTAGLVFGKNGDLYSATQAGGTGTGCGVGGCGTVFEVSP